MSYGDKITSTIFESDLGAADGLNKGFALATGDVYGFLNADDILRPRSLRSISEFFTRYADIDIVLGNGHTIDGQGQEIRHYRARAFTPWRFLHGGTQWLQQSMYFRADAYGRSPKFNIENRTCWDGELLVSMVTRGARVGYLNVDLSGFRIHDLSITGSGENRDQYLKDSRRIFKAILGRDWNWVDEIFRFFYRVEGMIRRISQV